MRRKAEPQKALPRSALANTKANTNIKARENTQMKVVKIIERPTKTPTGRGLGKAGAKRLGRLLKRAIQKQGEPAGRRRVSLPQTPVRLFKHQIQTEAENAPRMSAAKPASHQVSQLILSVVSQCKHRGGLSMVELKKTLAAEGYNVTKNSRQVNMVTRRLINNETLVRMTRSKSFRLNNKNQKDTKKVQVTTVKSSKPADLEQNNAAVKALKRRETAQRQARRTPKPKGKLQKTKGKTGRAATKSPKPARRTRRVAAKSQKPARRTRRAGAKSQTPKKKTLKAKRKSPKPAGRKSRATTNKATQVRKVPRTTQRAPRRRAKQNQHPYKSSPRRQPTKRRLPKTRSRLPTRQRRDARRRAYYYYY